MQPRAQSASLSRTRFTCRAGSKTAAQTARTTFNPYLTRTAQMRAQSEICHATPNGISSSGSKRWRLKTRMPFGSGAKTSGRSVSRTRAADTRCPVIVIHGPGSMLIETGPKSSIFREIHQGRRTYPHFQLFAKDKFCEEFAPVDNSWMALLSDFWALGPCQRVSRFEHFLGFQRTVPAGSDCSCRSRMNAGSGFMRRATLGCKLRTMNSDCSSRAHIANTSDCQTIRTRGRPACFTIDRRPLVELVARCFYWSASVRRASTF